MRGASELLVPVYFCVELSVVMTFSVGTASMRWFGFGFNAFGQICAQERLVKGDTSDGVGEVRVSVPTELHVDEGGGSVVETSQIRASWSRRASLRLGADSCVCMAGFSGVPAGAKTCGCRDAVVTESHLTLAFPDRVESWDLQSQDDTPSWSMEIIPQSQSSDVRLPLVPGGYIACKPPIFRSLSPHLQAKSLALGGDHAILLTATGAVYSWGLGSHGQLGHGGLSSEEEPRTVEALWGVPMSSVAAGGWHSVCVSDGGDLYVWGWNESGQLGLPSRSLRKATQQKSAQQADVGTSSEEELHDEVFISIQGFPALLDVEPSCEIRTVSCGSRHTAAVTATGSLYTWGWGEYGQLGHQTLNSSDEPRCVEFFGAENLLVVDVVCGPWNTFTAAVKKEVLELKNKSPE
ncbi:RCC1 domain-containing protein 1 [Kryptolebias marmoratus]|uniref:RCC1 domain containing 1 n=1 Tax=Kryptolebias marmoratus TaxID=37003 RepID=A0A3Q2ZJH9_KRYMA|nr:RCC1 domain-containing protein 1 [Kryptolebias marmoratus]